MIVVSNGPQSSRDQRPDGPTENRNANSVIVTGPGASWQMGKDLFVGSNAAFNLLIVSNGRHGANRVGKLALALARRATTWPALTGSRVRCGVIPSSCIGRFGPGNQLQVSTAGAWKVSRHLGGESNPAAICMALGLGSGIHSQHLSSLSVGASSVGNRPLVISKRATASEAKATWLSHEQQQQ